jgi:RNA polymerase sigma-70 factor (ECF subfamily)
MEFMSGDLKLDGHCGYASLSEIEIVELARIDPEAFSELVQRHRTWCMRTALSILRNHADAEDAVQSSFLSAFVHLPEFQVRGAFRTWLTRIVINQCLTIIRRGRPARTLSMGTGRDPEAVFAVEPRSPRKSPEEIGYENELSGLLVHQTGRLPAIYKHAFSMQHIEGLDTESVALRLQITPEAAKSRLNRARKELRKRLETHLCTRHSVSAVSIARPSWI